MSETEKDEAVAAVKAAWGDRNIIRAGQPHYVPPVRDGGATDQLIRLALPIIWEAAQAAQREADAAIAVSMIDNEPDGYYGQACSEVAAAIRGASDD